MRTFSKQEDVKGVHHKEYERKIECTEARKIGCTHQMCMRKKKTKLGGRQEEENSLTLLPSGWLRKLSVAEIIASAMQSHRHRALLQYHPR